MHSITSRTSLAATAATIAAAAHVVTGTVAILDEQSAENTIVGIEHLAVTGMSVWLYASAFLVVHLARRAGAPRRGLIAAVAMTLLATLTVVSNIRGTDPSFFAAIAVPSNLGWLIGLLAVVPALWRERVLPRALVATLPLTWFFSIPMAMAGGSLLAAAWFAATAWRLRTTEAAQGPLGQPTAPAVLHAA